MLAALLTRDDVAHLLNIAPATLSRSWRAWHTSKGFPAPVLGSERGARPRWHPDDIESWLMRPRPANDYAVFAAHSVAETQSYSQSLSPYTGTLLAAAGSA